MRRIQIVSIVALLTPSLIAQERLRVPSGTTLPQNCGVGDVFYKTSATIGLHECFATDTWRLVNMQGGGGIATDDPRLSDARTPLPHTHAVTDTTGLQIVLDGKAASAHTHTKAAITDFAHTHPQSDVTNLVTDLAGKAPTAHTHTDAEIPNTITVNTATTAATATALAGNPTDCATGEFANAIDASGNLTCGTPAGGGGSAGPTYVNLGANVVSAVTAYANLTGLSWAIAANARQEVECHFQFNTNATTTGLGVSWSGPASPTQTFGHLIASLTTTTGGQTTIVGNDTGVATTGVPATTNNVARFNGTWRNGANAGTIQMRLRSEVAVANGVTVLAGSWCKYQSF